MLFDPRLCAAQTRFLGAGEDDADLGVFELDARVLHCLEDCDAHVAAGEVVVCAVDGGVGVPHEVHTDEEGHKYEMCYSAPEQRFAVDEGVGVKRELGHVEHIADSDRRDDAEHEGDERTDDAGADVSLVDLAAPLVVDGPVPRRIGVTVEEDACIDFAFALLDGGDIVSCLFGEYEVDHLFVEPELQNHDCEPERDENDAEQRHDKEHRHSREGEGDGEVNPPEEGVRILFERLEVRAFATAILFQDIGHVLAGELFALLTGGAFGQILADVGDFVHHVLRAVRFAVDKFFQISHECSSVIKVVKL